MSIDLEKLMRLDMSYPGISFGYHSWALGAYLDSLENFIGFAQEQYRLRGKRDLEKRKEEFHPEEYIQKLSQVDEAADEHIPRYARLSALVPIWGLFEFSVTDITTYVSRREGAKLKLREVRAQRFMDQVQKYYDGVLDVPLPWTEEDKAAARTLHTIRNAIAHRNGHFLDASPEQRAEIEKAVGRASGVTTSGNDLVVGSVYVEQAANLVFRMVGELNRLVSHRYDGPIVP